MEENSGNYQPQIHSTNYESEFLKIRLDASRLAPESLNGKWNLAQYLYGTCRRAERF